MNRVQTILILTITVFISSLAYGQESKKYLKLKESYNYREGYVLMNDSSKVKGLIKDDIMNESQKYSVVNLVHPDGSRTKYYPKEIKAFSFSIYKFISDGTSFYRIITKGKSVTLYKNISRQSWTAPAAGPGSAPMNYSTQNETFYVKRESETEFKEVRRRKFIQIFSEYFKDCEEVVQKIQSKEYTHKDIKRIVSKYNYCK